MRKNAFTESQFSGGLGPGRFGPYASFQGGHQAPEVVNTFAETRPNRMEKLADAVLPPKTAGWSGALLGSGVGGELGYRGSRALADTRGIHDSLAELGGAVVGGVGGHDIEEHARKALGIRGPEMGLGTLFGALVGDAGGKSIADTTLRELGVGPGLVQRGGVLAGGYLGSTIGEHGADALSKALTRTRAPTAAAAKTQPINPLAVAAGAGAAGVGIGGLGAMVMRDGSQKQAGWTGGLEGISSGVALGKHLGRNDAPLMQAALHAGGAVAGGHYGTKIEDALRQRVGLHIPDTGLEGLLGSLAGGGIGQHLSAAALKGQNKTVQDAGTTLSRVVGGNLGEYGAEALGKYINRPAPGVLDSIDPALLAVGAGAAGAGGLGAIALNHALQPQQKQAQAWIAPVKQVSESLLKSSRNATQQGGAGWKNYLASQPKPVRTLIRDNPATRAQMSRHDITMAPEAHLSIGAMGAKSVPHARDNAIKQSLDSWGSHSTPVHAQGPRSNRGVLAGATDADIDSVFEKSTAALGKKNPFAGTRDKDVSKGLGWLDKVASAQIYVAIQRGFLQGLVKDASLVAVVKKMSRGAKPPRERFRVKVGAALTPAGRLRSSQIVGKSPAAFASKGESISQQIKPKGFGMPLAGATKS